MFGVTNALNTLIAELLSFGVVALVAVVLLNIFAHRRRHLRPFELLLINTLRFYSKGATLPEIQRDIMRSGNPEPKIGKLYVTCERLRIDAIVDSEMRDAVDLQGRTQPKRFYWVTNDGNRRFAEDFERHQRSTPATAPTSGIGIGRYRSLSKRKNPPILTNQRPLSRRSMLDVADDFVHRMIVAFDAFSEKFLSEFDCKIRVRR